MLQQHRRKSGGVCRGRSSGWTAGSNTKTPEHDGGITHLIWPGFLQEELGKVPAQSAGKNT